MLSNTSYFATCNGALDLSFRLNCTFDLLLLLLKVDQNEESEIEVKQERRYEAP
jgi:hypothetical protein